MGSYVGRVKREATSLFISTLKSLFKPKKASQSDFSKWVKRKETPLSLKE